MRDWLRTRLLPVLITGCFLLLPAWLRWRETPPFLPDLYAARHVLVLPMLAALALWLALRAPGLRALSGSRWRLIWLAALLALAGWSALSTTWALMRATRPEVAETAAFQFVVVAAFAVVTACAGPRPRVIIRALAAGLALLAALTLAQALAGQPLGLEAFGEFGFGPDVPDSSLLRAGDLTYYRPAGLTSHPNIHAGMLMAGTLAAAALWFERRRATQIIGAVLAAAGFGALLLTFSRAGLVGLAAGGLAGLLMLWPRLRRREGVRALLLAAGLAAVAGGVLAAAYGPFFSARVTVSEPVEMRSVADRIVFTNFALRAIAEHPLTGVGIGSFPWQASYYLRDTFFALRGDNVHNLFLTAAAEQGLVGLALLLMALVSGLAAAWRAVRTGPGQRDADRAALLAIVIALLTVGLFDHYPATIFHTQALLWGSLAAALSVENERR